MRCGSLWNACAPNLASSLVQPIAPSYTLFQNIALPSAQADLGFSDANRQWIVTAYALAFGSLLLFGGRLSDLLGRKWVVVQDDGSRMVIEGDGIVGETPRLAPGEEFSYNSFHVTGVDAVVHGSFHGIDEAGRKVHVILPPFEMNIPRPGAA